MFDDIKEDSIKLFCILHSYSSVFSMCVFVQLFQLHLQCLDEVFEFQRRIVKPLAFRDWT